MECSSLNSHLYRKNIVPTPSCECGSFESPYHFLFQYPRYAAIRDTYLHIYLDSHTTREILYGKESATDLENEALFLNIQEFIIKSKCFVWYAWMSKKAQYSIVCCSWQCWSIPSLCLCFWLCLSVSLSVSVCLSVSLSLILSTALKFDLVYVNCTSDICTCFLLNSLTIHIIHVNVYHVARRWPQYKPPA